MVSLFLRPNGQRPFFCQLQFAFFPACGMNIINLDVPIKKIHPNVIKIHKYIDKLNIGRYYLEHWRNYLARDCLWAQWQME